MARIAQTSRIQRLALLGATAGLAAGGALLPTSAFAAPATSHTGSAAVVAHHHGDRHGDERGNHHRRTSSRETTTETSVEFGPDGRVTKITKKVTTKETRSRKGDKNVNALVQGNAGQ
ncbi:hypothetical protein GCM10010503_47680 [Streptomyces lucensis JCM 4490]|uniref:Uncharacterized protein n=1 Tax=Streptomyces lucensis JCM 4490 TaxID=1306176 RepID=A0A918J9R1_9ACTN|nr:hypothetical protein [Streptomyces lucensis]GGW65152.1 hypothetical protein GCM10010503_47680 [Streptomyces lucensis JCM 4490]